MNELSQIRQGAFGACQYGRYGRRDDCVSSGLRIEIDRRRGRGAGSTRAAGSNRCGARPSTMTAGRRWRSCRLQDRGADRKAAHDHHPQRFARHPFDRSINPYRGCEHGCIYCFARPTHAYMGLSPGLDFEAKLFAKPDAPSFWSANWQSPATSRARSPSAPTPIPTSRSRRNGGSCARSSKC
jgi:hypothetical protein